MNMTDLFFDSKNPEVIFEKLYDEKGIAGSSASLVYASSCRTW